MQERRSKGKNDRHRLASSQIEAEDVQKPNVACSLTEVFVDNKENVDPSNLAKMKTMSVLQNAENLSIINPGSKALDPQDPQVETGDEGRSANSTPQDKYLEVKSTPDRGLGVFATRKIKAGTLILSEQSLLSLCKDEEDDHSAVEREFMKLSRADQRKYPKLFDAEKSRMPRVASIYYSNCYNLDSLAPDGKGGSAIGNLASRFNHSCIANAQFSYDFDHKQMMFYAIRDIPRGREVCSNYEKNVFETATRRIQKLRMYYGFGCGCEACQGGDKNEFWGRSDERRKAMLVAFRQVKQCDKIFLKQEAENGWSDDESKNKVLEEAISALTRLETLLLKECLTGIVLSNTYRSLSKWCERNQQLVEAVKWKEMEWHNCTMGLGGHAYRTREAGKKLTELKEKTSSLRI